MGNHGLVDVAGEDDFVLDAQLFERHFRGTDAGEGGADTHDILGVGEGLLDPGLAIPVNSSVAAQIGRLGRSDVLLHISILLGFC